MMESISNPTTLIGVEHNDKNEVVNSITDVENHIKNPVDVSDSTISAAKSLSNDIANAKKTEHTKMFRDSSIHKKGFFEVSNNHLINDSDSDVDVIDREPAVAISDMHSLLILNNKTPNPRKSHKIIKNPISLCGMRTVNVNNKRVNTEFDHEFDIESDHECDNELDSGYDSGDQNINIDVVGIDESFDNHIRTCLRKKVSKKSKISKKYNGPINRQLCEHCCKAIYTHNPTTS